MTRIAISLEERCSLSLSFCLFFPIKVFAREINIIIYLQMIAVAIVLLLRRMIEIIRTVIVEENLMSTFANRYPTDLWCYAKSYLDGILNNIITELRKRKQEKFPCRAPSWYSMILAITLNKRGIMIRCRQCMSPMRLFTIARDQFANAPRLSFTVN